MTAGNDTHRITRNVSFFKRFQKTEPFENSSDVENNDCADPRNAADDHHIPETFPVVIPEDSDTDQEVD